MRMDEDKRAKLQKLADAQKRSLANYIDTVLDQHLETQRRESAMDLSKVARLY